MKRAEDSDQTMVTLELTRVSAGVCTDAHGGPTLVIRDDDTTVELVGGGDPTGALAGARRVVEAFWTLQVAIRQGQSGERRPAR
jgi:hypothetical protein